MKVKEWIREHAAKLGAAIGGLAIAAIAAACWDIISASPAWLAGSWETPRWLVLLLIAVSIALGAVLVYVYRKHAEPPIEYGDRDIIAILTSWMGHRPSSKNTRVIQFRELDRELKLKPGSAKKHLKTAAAQYHYYVKFEGDETIIFEERNYH